MHYPWPIQIQKHPEDPNLKFILTMKLLYTYFWETLIGRTVWVAFLPFNRASFNHLKTACVCAPCVRPRLQRTCMPAHLLTGRFHGRRTNIKMQIAAAAWYLICILDVLGEAFRTLVWSHVPNRCRTETSNCVPAVMATSYPGQREKTSDSTWQPGIGRHSCSRRSPYDVMSAEDLAQQSRNYTDILSSAAPLPPRLILGPHCS